MVWLNVYAVSVTVLTICGCPDRSKNKMNVTFFYKLDKNRYIVCKPERVKSCKRNFSSISDSTTLSFNDKCYSL